MSFLDDLNKMPFHIIEKAEFKEMKVIITFKSGNQIAATSTDKKQYEQLKKEMLKNIGQDKVVIKDVW